MDLQKIQVRQDLERMVTNYFLMGKISREQSDMITHYVDDVIGGGCFPKLIREGKIITFPGIYETIPSKTPEESNPPRPHIRDYLAEQGVHFRGNIVWALYYLGAYNLETIAALSVKELSKVRWIGKKAIADIRAFLQSKGLDLRGETL
jgi:hypothetical protein